MHRCDAPTKNLTCTLLRVALQMHPYGRKSANEKSGKPRDDVRAYMHPWKAPNERGATIIKCKNNLNSQIPARLPYPAGGRCVLGVEH